MARRRLAAAEGDDEQRREGTDAAPDERDRVQRRLVGPVDVLEHEDRRAGRPLELLDEQRLDLVRRGARRESLCERRRDPAAKSRKGPSGRGIVRSSHVPSSTRDSRLEPLEETRDERRLADSRLAGDEDDPSVAALRRRVRGGERLERMPTFE